MAKSEEEYQLTDKIVAAIDNMVEKEAAARKKLKAEMPSYKDQLKRMRAELKERLEHPSYFTDGFKFHADKIHKQVRDHGWCTKSQLEYLILYNNMMEEKEQLKWSMEDFDKFKVINDA